MLAELQVYALAKQWMPEYSSRFWHFIRLPEGGGYMMPDGGRVHLVSSENWFDRGQRRRGGHYSDQPGD